MPNCKEVATAISSGELERAGFAERLRIRIHLWMCKYCRAYLRQIQKLGDAARHLMKAEPPDPERIQRLEDELVELCGSKRTEPPE